MHFTDFNSISFFWFTFGFMIKTIAPLEQGNKVAITCPAGAIKKDKIEFAIQALQSWGLQVIVGETVGNQYLDFSGTDKMRAEEFQDFLNDDEIKAIFCARGGYGSARIIDSLSFENFQENPKWIIGYSDVTVFHAHIHQKLNCPTIHAVMPSGFDSSFKESFFSLKYILLGKDIRYKFLNHPLNQKGIAQGKLIGGNLTILQSLLGSISQLNTTGKILFLEDVGEKLYNIDRMMVSLKRAGQLSHLAGLIVGGFTHMKGEDFGKDAQEIISEHCSQFGYPIAFGFPAGHQKDNRALPFGMPSKLTVSDECFLEIKNKH